MDQGYIKLYRQLRGKGYYQDSHYVHLWVHLLLRANHKKTELLWDGGIIKLKAGQLIVSRQSLSEETGIEQSKVERIIKLLKTEQQIEQKSYSKFRVITILNWGKYQENNKKVEQINEQQMNSRRTAGEQQVNTDNNDNNDNNNKNEKKRVCLILKDWNEKQNSPIPSFRPENIVSKHGAEKVIKLIATYGPKNGGFALFLEALKS